MDPIQFAQGLFGGVIAIGEGITTEGVTSGAGLEPWAEFQEADALTWEEMAALGYLPEALQEELAEQAVLGAIPNFPMEQHLQTAPTPSPLARTGALAPSEQEEEGSILPLVGLALGGLLVGTVVIGGIAYAATR